MGHTSHYSSLVGYHLVSILYHHYHHCLLVHPLLSLSPASVVLSHARSVSLPSWCPNSPCPPRPLSAAPQDSMPWMSVAVVSPVLKTWEKLVVDLLESLVLVLIVLGVLGSVVSSILLDLFCLLDCVQG